MGNIWVLLPHFFFVCQVEAATPLVKWSLGELADDMPRYVGCDGLMVVNND